jgi:hypothetical protein
MAKFTLELVNDSLQDLSVSGLIFSILIDLAKVLKNPALRV